MWKTSVGTVVILWFAQTAHGGPLQIIGETWQADSESSCSVTLKAASPGLEGVSLSCWQMVCQIVPTIGSPTNAFFTELPDYTPASHFVFGDQSSAYRGDESPSGTAFGAFSADPSGSVNVQPPNTNLLQFSLTSPNAVGTFDIVLAPYIEPEFGSFWIDSLGQAQPFSVVSPPGRPDGVVATVVFSAIPEPPNGIMLLAGLTALTLIWVARRKACHCQG